MTFFVGTLFHPTTPKGCSVQFSLLGIVHFAFSVVVIYWRPFRTSLQNLFAATGLFVIALILSCSAASVLLPKNRAVPAAISAFALIQTILTILRIANSISTWGFERRCASIPLEPEATWSDMPSQSNNEQELCAVDVPLVEKCDAPQPLQKESQVDASPAFEVLVVPRSSRRTVPRSERKRQKSVVDATNDDLDILLGILEGATPEQPLAMIQHDGPEIHL